MSFNIWIDLESGQDFDELIDETDESLLEWDYANILSDGVEVWGQVAEYAEIDINRLSRRDPETNEPIWCPPIEGADAFDALALYCEDHPDVIGETWQDALPSALRLVAGGLRRAAEVGEKGFNLGSG